MHAQSLMGSLVNSSTPGVRHEIDGVASTFTTSADMVGLEIMVYFANGSTDVGIWTGNGVNQNNWSFTLPPNSTSFSTPFSLTNNTGSAITRFALHGAGSDTFFDRDITPDTPGTFRGRDVMEFTRFSLVKTSMLCFLMRFRSLERIRKQIFLRG